MRTDPIETQITNARALSAAKNTRITTFRTYLGCGADSVAGEDVDCGVVAIGGAAGVADVPDAVDSGADVRGADDNNALIFQE